MNKTYRLVWCSFRNAWIAVSELSKSKTKSSKTRTVASIIFSGLMVTFSAGAFASPNDPLDCQPIQAPNQVNHTNAFYGNNIVCQWNTTNSTLVGNNITAAGNTDNLVVVGNGNNISTAGGRSTVLGSKIDHSGRFTTVIGQNIKSNTEHSIVMGEDTTIDGGNYDISIGGNQNILNSHRTVALGNNIKTSESLDSLAAGNNTAIIKSRLATAVGDRTSVTDSTASSAFGAGSSIKKADHSTAVGAGASVNESNFSFAGGEKALVTGGYGDIAFGFKSTVSNATQSTAIGYQSSVTGNSRGMALGTLANVTDSYGGTALGASTSVSSSTASSAIGAGSSVTGGSDSSAIGKGASVSGSKNSTAVGTSASVTSSYFALASGASANVTNGFASSASGNNASVTDSSYAQADGAGAKVTLSKSATAVGNDAIVTNSGSATAVGNGANITNSASSVAVGQLASVTNSNVSTASGYKAKITDSYQAQAYGTGNSITNSNQASAFGVNSSITSSASGVAIGNNAKLNSAADGIAIGSSADVTSVANGIAIGKNVKVDGENSVSLGPNSAVSAVQATAIGSLANATKDNSVALGANATTDTDATQQASATLNGLNYGTFEGQVTDPGMQVSVGSVGAERQIKNVGSGEISTTSTDAINGSQLYATNAVLGNVANSTKNIIGGDVTLDAAGNVTGPFIANSNSYTTIAEAIEGEAAAAKTEVEEGKNISVTSTTGTDGQTIYTVATADEVEFDKVTVGSVVVDAANNDITGLANTTLGAADFATAGRAATEEQLSSVSDSVADIIGGGVTNVGGAVTGPMTVNNNSYTTIVDAIEGEAAAAKTEVEEGKNISVTSTTGTDGQTIYTVATADEVEFDKVTVGNTTITTDGLTIVGGPSITTAGINAGGKKVTNVADGEIAEDSTDAVNGSQLYALGDNITNIFGGNANYANNQIIWTNIGGTGKDTIDEAIQYVNNQATNANQGWKVITDSGTAATSTVKPGDIVNIKGDTASGVTVTNSGNDITVGLGDQITVGTGANAVSIDGNGGTIQVGDINIDGTTNTITAGKVSLNGDSGTVNGLTNITWNPADIVSGQAATEDQLKQVADNAAQAAAAAKSTVTEGENVTVTQSKNADGSTNYQVATKKDVTFDSVTSGSVSADKVIVGNVVIDQAGISAGGNKVSNLADGTISSTSKDAINGSQLHASNTNIYNYLGGGANYETNTGPTYNVGGGSHNNVGDALDALDDRDTQLDNKITNLGDQLQQAFYTTNERIDGVEKRANAGIAAAMALETAPYVAGKWTYAAATAYHGGENAVGVTLRKTADNGRWSLTGGIAAASEGDPSFRIGISGVID